MVLAAAACFCVTVAGAACTLAAFCVSQDGRDHHPQHQHHHHPPAPPHGLPNTPPFYPSSASSSSWTLTPPPPAPEAEGDWEVPRDVQQRLLRLRRRVQRAELEQEQRRQGRQRRREARQRQYPWRRLVAMPGGPEAGGGGGGAQPPAPAPPVRGMGLAAVMMLTRARVRRWIGAGGGRGEQQPQQREQQRQQPPPLPAIHRGGSNTYVLAASAHPGNNSKASYLALLLAHAGRSPSLPSSSSFISTTSGSGVSPLTLAVFASRRAAVAGMLAGPKAAEYLASVDVSGRSAVWWACRWGEVGILRRLLRTGGDERLPDHRGLTPRDAARIGPYPRPCLALLKEAARANLLHKARVLLEAEESLACANNEPEPAALPLPRVRLRPVPPPASCWWIPGGKGSGWIGTKQAGRVTERVAMTPVPRDVRAGVLEMVVGKGLSDDVFVELKAFLV